MGDTLDIRFVQGQRLTLGIRYELDGEPLPVPTPVRWQVREQQSTTSALLVDLAPYVTVTHGRIDLDVPAATVSTITQPGRHDCFAGDLLLFQGRTSVDPAVSV